jgi:hypothetical protein
LNASQPDAYGVIRQLVIDHAGGYLRNVVWGPPTCPHCAGIPGNSGFSTCYACDGYIARTGQLSDRRGFVTYALAGAQSGANMYRYKDDVAPPAATRMMTLLLAATLTKHLDCAAHPELGPVTAWTTVPSLSGRPNHPLPALAAPFLRTLSWVALRATADAKKSRDLRLENFLTTNEGQSPAGQHVLLLDDTWVTGSNPESAAGALKRDGATAVTSLVIARWLDVGRGATSGFIKSHLTQDFDPIICPFTGRPC